MLFLSATGTSQPDYIALGMVLVMALIVAAMTVRKYLSNKKAAAQAAAVPVVVAAPAAPKPAAPKPTAPGSAGKLKLHDVEPKTAAMIMAIVADTMGKPINELRFLSIKEVK